jgi:uncharacterized protein (TIGR03067 family)
MKNSSITVGTAILLLLLCLSPLAGQSLNGEWEVIAGQFSGQTVPQTALQTMKLKIQRQQFEAHSGSAVSTGQYSENARSQPPQLVFTIADGVDAGRVIKAIYKVDEAGLTIVYSQGEEFPTEFESTSANQNLLLTYQSKATAASTARKSSGGRQYGQRNLKVSVGSTGK